jgi:MoaA/NifB/PqqE/SkfB family radical SAM enzyme
MTVERFKEVIRKCQGMPKLKVLYLHGNGEPLINPKIIDFVKISKKAELAEQIILVTNGVLLKKEMFRELSAAGVSCIRVSLDAYDAKKYYETKGADFGGKVIANIERCMDLIVAEKLTTKLVLLCAEPNDVELGDETRKIAAYFTKWIKKIPNIEIHCRRIFNWVESINRLNCFNNDTGHVYSRPLPCEQLFYLLMVHSDGDISACCGDVTKRMVVENIGRVKSMDAVVGSDILRKWRRGSLELNYNSMAACKRCETFSSVDSVLLERKAELLPFLGRTE